MIGNTMNPTSDTIARVLRWSSTGNAVAWLDRRSGSYMTLQVSLQQSVVVPLLNPVVRSSGLNLNVIAHRRRLPARTGTTKSP
jgi:hypothetical protein